MLCEFLGKVMFPCNNLRTLSLSKKRFGKLGNVGHPPIDIDRKADPYG